MAPSWKPLPVTFTVPPDSQMRGVATPVTATPLTEGGALTRTVTEYEPPSNAVLTIEAWRFQLVPEPVNDSASQDGTVKVWEAPQ